MKPTLYIFLGIPGSGKTYFVKHLCEQLGLVHLSSDHMRKSMFGNPDRFEREIGNPMVFGALDYSIAAILSAGHSVAYDSNHNLKSIRDKTRQIAYDLGIPVVLTHITVPLDIAVKRAGEREEDMYTRRIPADRVIRQSEIIQIPDGSEPHVTIDGTQPFEDQFVSFQNQQ
jgi:predicted kinase